MRKYLLKWTKIATTFLMKSQNCITLRRPLDFTLRNVKKNVTVWVYRKK